MDAAEPPRVVFEGARECADRDRAEQLFRQELEAARARGWVVTIRIDAAMLPAVSGEGEITDETGASRARQVLSGDASNCAGLAHSVAAWASGVLQANAPSVPTQSGTAPGLPGAAPAPPGTTPSPPAAPTPTAPLPSPPPSVSSSLAPSSSTPSRTAPSVSAAGAGKTMIRDFSVPSLESGPQYEESAPLEIGVGTFLMAGGGSGGYIGLAPFLIDDVGQAVFLRPSAAVGVSMATNLPSTLAAARLDTCMRLPGRYAVRGGLQLDLCGGADVGFSYLSSGTTPGTPATGQTLPYVDLGPSADLRAEAGSIAITLRGVAGVNVARPGFDDVTGEHIDMPILSWRLEVDFAWVFHSPRAESLFVARGASQPGR